MSFVLTIDIGTTSAKVLIVSDTGKVVASAQEFYPTHFPQPGFAVQDPKVVTDGIVKIIRQAKDQFSGKITAIGVSSAMHSLMSIDERGNPLTPLILWSDMRSTEQAKKLQRSDTGAAIYKVTGTPIHPMSPLCKLVWMNEYEPELIKKTWKFISIKEYLFLVLCGKFHIDHSVASSSGLFDVHKLRWSEQALAIAGIPSGKLSDCVSAYDKTLRLKKEMATSLGLDADTPIVPGASDGCLAHLGSNAMEKGRLSLTIGTSGAVRMASKTYSPDPHCRLFNYRLDEERFIAGGATNNGTVLVNWFCNNFYSGKTTDIVEFAKTASSVEAGGCGLLFLPYVFGERAPHYNPDLRGVFFGLAQHHTQSHLMRSLLEGICLEVRSIVESVEQSIGEVNEILASGGFVRSTHWLQIMADVLQKEITVHDVNDASSLGAAMIAFKSMGHSVTFDGSGKKMVFKPDTSLNSLYDDLYGIFSRSTRALANEFGEIVKLQRS
ncbi:MAG TPA: gluconokinase [Cyclobacteriaceae bacterium]|nr:gluconokinase [Cyclobacteriaceae bacterium]